MKATTIILAFALIVAVSNAQTNYTGYNCTSDHSVCASKSPQLCCANVVRYVNASYSNSTQQCVNQTLANKTVEYKNLSSVYGNATCIVSATSTSNNSFFVKLSVAVASLGFLSLFLWAAKRYADANTNLIIIYCTFYT